MSFKKGDIVQVDNQMLGSHGKIGIVEYAGSCSCVLTFSGKNEGPNIVSVRNLRKYRKPVGE